MSLLVLALELITAMAAGTAVCLAALWLADHCGARAEHRVDEWDTRRREDRR